MENEMTDYGYMKKGGKWIQKVTASIRKKGTEGVCTGSKFGGPSCPPGSKRYNLAKTFRAMAKKRGQEGLQVGGENTSNKTASGMHHPYASSGLKLKEAYMKRGGIHIKPENKGKFTASAKKAGMSVQGYASKIMANKEKYSPTLVKRANFAKNAAKWKKG